MSDMKYLHSLLEASAPGVCRGLSPQLRTVEIRGVSLDSRRIESGGLFIAVPGHKLDGRRFIEDAIKRGAAAVLTEDSVQTRESLADCDVPAVYVPDVRATAARLAKIFYDDPTARLMSFGVTGTNGKTSVSWIIAELLALSGQPAAHVGTLGARVVETSRGMERERFIDTGTTTPDGVWLQSFLRRSEARGLKALSMEASSHGLVQERTAGVEWDCAIFTNLTRDHLDFHGTFENYGQAKLKLFIKELTQSRKHRKFAVVNAEDPFSETIAEALIEHPEIDLLRFSDRAGAAANCFPLEVSSNRLGTRIRANLRGQELSFETRLVGAYNVSNMLCALLAASTVLEPQSLAELAGLVKPVPGRLELVAAADVSVFVDYAHTPDALVRAHESLREIAEGRRLITVFGCGGDRDRGKRPMMGRVVAELADFGVVTSDNPRTEDPQAIIDEILPGVCEPKRSEFRYEVNPDRREAILRAVREAQPGDLVLIAGKGHEDYQEIHGVKHHFSDVEAAREALAAVGLI